MKILAQHIFDEFKEKILQPHYHPATSIETFKSRLTASWILLNNEHYKATLVEEFIKKTSLSKQEDLAYLQSIGAQIKTWEQLHICSTYTNARGTFLEYKLSFTTLNGLQKTIHFHARYEIHNQACYFVSQTTPLIRVIGDPILHQAGIFFPRNPTPAQQQELERQIEHAKSVLIQTGGAGIAANQCAELEHPYRFTIVGVFYEVPEHVRGLQERYPNTKFPAARIMVNPVVTAFSAATQQFSHGCLSVPCSNRCEVKSPIEMRVTYQDPTQNMITQQITVRDVDAIVLWHELTHILHGKTYVDVAFESLPLPQLFQLKSMLSQELQKRNQAHYDHVPDLSVPPFYLSVKINASGSAQLDSHELAIALSQMTDETVAGLFTRCVMLLDD